MAGNSSIIGALAVALDLDSAQFEAGAAKAQRAASGLEGGLAGLGRAALPMVGGLLAGTSALAVFSAGMAKAGETAQYADDLAAAATRIGETAEALQELRHAGEANDIPVEKLDAGLMGLNSTLGALRTRIGDGKIRKAFDELGIPQSTLAGMNSASDLLPLLADKISALGNHADQLQIAKKLQIEDLLPLLLNGAKGIDELRQRARDLGVVLDEDVVNRMADMNETLRVADERSKIAGMSLGTALVPALVALKTHLADAYEWMAKFIDRFNAIDNRARATLVQQRGTYAAQLMQFPDKAVGLDGWRKAEVQKRLDAVTAELDRRTWLAPEGGPGSGGNGDGRGFKLTAPGKGKKDSSNTGPFVESLHTFVSEGGLADVRAAIKPAIEGTIVDVAGTVAKGFQKNRQAIADQWRWTIEGGFQAFAYGGGKGLMRYLADQFRDGLSKRLTDWVMTLLEGGGKGSGGSGGSAVLSTMLTAGKALFGFASGGSFKVGGSGGVDSQLVQFKASPDERVTITRPDQAFGGAMNLTVNVHAAGAFTRADLERAVEVGASAAFAAARQQVPDDLADQQKYRLG